MLTGMGVASPKFSKSDRKPKKTNVKPQKIHDFWIKGKIVISAGNPEFF